MTMLTDYESRLAIGRMVDDIVLGSHTSEWLSYPAPASAPLVEMRPEMAASSEGNPGFWLTIGQGLSGAWLNVSEGIRSFLSSDDVQRGAGDVGSGIGRGIGDVGSGVGRGVGDGVGGIGKGAGGGLKIGLAIGIPAAVVAGYFILRK